MYILFDIFENSIACSSMSECFNSVTSIERGFFVKKETFFANKVILFELYFFKSVGLLVKPLIIFFYEKL